MLQNQTRDARALITRWMAPWRIGLVGAVLCCFWMVAPSPVAPAQEEAPEEAPAAERDPWEPFRLLPGTWEGSIDGRLGQGTGVRRYEFLHDERFLLSRHSSVRLPQEKSPKGDHHRELGVFSFDRERGTIVYREFIVEGFVLRYTCAVEPRRFVCTTESVENGSGMRARLTVEVADRFRLDEIFELASPGQELQVYFTNRWTRRPALDD
jgi:hypothetical protein